MRLDKTFSLNTLILTIAAFLFPMMADIKIPLIHGRLVFWIETGQAFWLFFGAVFTLCYLKPLSLPDGPRQFWLWSATWWLVLLGRSINWGREFFPHGPKPVFLLIAIVLIGALVLTPVFSASLRKNIKHRLRHEVFPFWTGVLVVATFLISDAVEHHRLISHLFLHDLSYQDLIEEAYEIPFMVGLFIIAFGMMKREKKMLAP